MDKEYQGYTDIEGDGAILKKVINIGFGSCPKDGDEATGTITTSNFYSF